jgi:predicted nuclease of predicted toxin-antitoxin system
MKVLVDACAGLRLARALRNAGHDAAFAGDWEPPPDDSAILAVAVRDARCVITRDKDFGALVFRDQYPHCGMIRLVRLAPAQEVAACLGVLKSHAESLSQGAIITIEPARIRIRKTPQRLFSSLGRYGGQEVVRSRFRCSAPVATRVPPFVIPPGTGRSSVSSRGSCPRMGGICRRCGAVDRARVRPGKSAVRRWRSHARGAR